MKSYCTKSQTPGGLTKCQSPGGHFNACPGVNINLFNRHSRIRPNPLIDDKDAPINDWGDCHHNWLCSRIAPTRGIILATKTGESLANSTITPDNSTESPTVAGKLESDKEIAAFFDRDYNECGDGGWSDQEGEEVNFHNDALEANHEEQVLRDEANNLGAEKEGLPSSWIPGAPGR